jgi:pepF/M3 family oligoendopeptidase
MNFRWDLSSLYTSFQSEEFMKDYNSLDKDIETLNNFAQNNFREESAINIKGFINLLNSFYSKFTRLYTYSELILSVNVNDNTAQRYDELLFKKLPKIKSAEVKFKKYLGIIDNIDKLIESTQELKEYEFFIKDCIKESSHILSDEEEVIIAKLQTTGSNAFANLQNRITSNLLISINLDGEDKKLPLPYIRNLAYSEKEDVRKKAYEAEISSYKNIELSSAACLNGIKGEVITLCHERGYESPLHMTLERSRMEKETLDVMLKAMEESLPYFRKYFKKKAELLGHSEGLPFYDLFAPVKLSDTEERKFTADEARAYIVKNFAEFSPKLSAFAEKAFENKWIDGDIREGKQGGAFCASIHAIGESRIMANFNGTLNDVITLSHELGHGYHGECLKDESYINSDYSMPIAETASIFCETIVKNAAIKEGSPEEAFTILEGSISDSAQVIVDILSRYYFETALFKIREDHALTPDELKEEMIKAQLNTYGDGLDKNFLHPYMWACKPHYYYVDSNFYNFPYAFGQLFAKGLYAKYLEKGQEFVDEYDKLLAVTGKKSIADAAKIMNVDVNDIDFWRGSLKIIEDEIEKFINIR